ncbi:TonB-dependent receptor [Alkalitalea saponilacus]|uniref:Iron complex outermembrane recepter protein n=1 Tax=Alkalitalea saponilacus TaxID=889453 RepID=A0A1T5HSK3_9BACT|nr:TonB-dependent receptor [Alkalitalea saponilacus]ASB48356.1 TonB-dependent receptor [Alkalitalea saponilacus]SKC23582.1 iron complex outermembrane recepter protein [Alkalitalea saponilacus]
MRKIVFILLLICTVSFSMDGQNRFEGSVVDENREPLAGAVLILDGQRSAVSGNDGRFTFGRITAGNYNLSVSFLGFDTYSAVINITGDVDREIQLNPRSHLTSEVVVSAYRAGLNSPVAHTNIRGEDLRTISVNDDLPFLLQMSPSLVATSETGIGVGYTGFRIRGSDPTRINVTVNGIPLNDSESQGVFWVNMPDFAGSVEEVQIQRGVGTSSHGAAAFGATVNFRTTTDAFEPFAEVASTAGAYNTFRNSVRLGTGLLNDRFSFEGRYSNLQSDGYIHNAFSDHESIYLSGTYHMNHSFLKFNVIHGDQKTGISWWGVPQEMLSVNRRYNPAGVYTDLDGNEQYYRNQTDNYIQTHYQLFYSHAFSNRTDMTAALHYTRGDGYYEQYRQNQRFSSYGLPNVFIGHEEITRTDLVRQKWLGNDFYGTVFSINSQLLPNVSVSAGGGWNRYDGDHFGNIIWARHATNMEKDHEWYFNNGTKTDYNVFGKLNYRINNLNTFIDLQVRGIDYDMTGIDDNLDDLSQGHSFTFFNPKAGVFYEINPNHQSYVSFGISNREPTRTNFKDANLDPDATPLPERLYNVEAGYNFLTPSLSANVNIFYMYYKDQLVPTGEKSSVGYDIMTNVEESYRAGVEVQWAWRPFPAFRWDANFTLSRNIIRDFVETATDYDDDWNEIERVTQLGDTDIAYSPSVIAGSMLTWNFFRNASLGLNSKYVGEQYFDNTSSSTRQLDAYLVHNFSLKYQLKTSWSKGVEFQLMVNNLTNLRYESNAYGGNWYEQGVENTWAYYYPMAPRHFMGQVVIRF